jgi:hypothetical protein
LTWITPSSGVSGYLLGAVSTPNEFIVVGDSTILTSPDGSDWTARTAGVSEWITGVSYRPSDDLRVACGGSGLILSSDDLSVTWSVEASGTTDWLNSITYGQFCGLFVAVGDAGTIITSPDGVTWTPRSSGVSDFLTFVAASEALELFVAVGDGGRILTSPDGATWTPRTSGTSSRLNGVVYSDNFSVLFAVGDGGVILTSGNGTTWSALTSGTSAGLYSVIDGPDKVFAGGDSGTIIFTMDGSSWAADTSPVSNAFYGGATDLVNSKYIFCGDSGRIVLNAEGVVIPSGDVEQEIDVLFVAPFGDVSRPLDLSFIPPWSFWGDRVIQPLTIRFTSNGDVVQPLDLSLVKPYGDVVQPLDLRFLGMGDVSQPLDIALRDPLARTQVWKVRTLVGGVDISNRTTGQGSVRAEEGGARIASLVLAPETGPIDAEAMSGQPIVIDFLMRIGDSWTARRLFTGKVNAPVWDVSRGTLALSCTDDLQNRIAALSRTAIDAITGGRFHLAVQGEQRNNWDYSQAVMESVAGSLDADAYGALRVTPWHTDSVWRTYTPANTEQDSIDFTLPTRTGIINKITGTFEYRFTRLHRRTASINYMGDMDKTVHYGLPLLARATVEAALEGSGWNFYYGGSAIGPGGGGETPWTVSDGQPVTPNIDYVPYPESYDLPGGGLWYQKETDTTCLGFRCSLWRRWAQTVTEKYELTVSAPESIAANGVHAREDRASLASQWDAGSWEADPAAKPALPTGGTAVTLDYAPDATTDDRDAAIATFLDTLMVEIDSTHRGARGSGRTWLTPELDLDKRLRIEKGDNAGEGKVISLEHSWDRSRGRAVTEFEIAITRHGAVGITPPDVSPSEAPPAPAVPAPSSAAFAALYDLPTLHIGALADSPDEDEDWTGWIVNVPANYNVDDPGSTEPSINPETQKTERRLVNDPYRGGTANPLYRADKAYSQTGFRVRLPAVEDEARDAVEPTVAAAYTLAILQDDFNLTA